MVSKRFFKIYMVVVFIAIVILSFAFANWERKLFKTALEQGEQNWYWEYLIKE